jgi:hypothetical protein
VSQALFPSFFPVEILSGVIRSVKKDGEWKVGAEAECLETQGQPFTQIYAVPQAMRVASRIP